MKQFLHQGDIVKIEKITVPILVTSKDFFNQTGEIIGCPIFSGGTEGALHIKIKTSNTEGYVHCEKMKLFDLNVRGFLKIDSLSISDLIDITDAIQSIFDYT